MKNYYYLTLLLLLLPCVNASAQVTWNLFLNNSNIDDAVEYKIAANNNAEVVLPYYIFNTVNSAYDIKVDVFSPPSVWGNIYDLQLNVQGSVEQAISITSSGEDVYILHINDDQFGNHSLLKYDQGGSVTLLSTTTGLLNTAFPFQLEAGTNANELYLAGTDPSGNPFAASYDFNTDTWNTFTSLVGSVENPTVYNNADTVYFGYNQNNGNDNLVYLYKAPKSNLSIGSGQLIGSAPITYDDGVSPTGIDLKSVERIMMLGNASSDVFVLSYDETENGSVSFKLNNTGGDLALDPGFVYSNDVQFSNQDRASYVAAPSGGNLKVMEKNHGGNTYTQYAPDLSLPSNYSNLVMATNDSLQHVLVSYLDSDAQPPSYEFRITNQSPTVVNQIPNDTVCGIGTVGLFKSFILEDLDHDTLILNGFTSFNPAVLDVDNNASMELTRVGATNNIQIFVNMDDAGITQPTKVAFSFQIFDGIGLTYYLDSVIVRPSTPVSIESEVDFCINGTQRDLFEIVDVNGGSFFDNTLNQTLASNFLPSTYYSAENTIDISYKVPGCYATVNSTFNIFAPPVPSLVSSTNVTACSGQDGQISAAIANGSSSNVTYIWNTGNNSSLSLSNLAVGTYVLNAFDDNSCKNKLVVNLSVQNLNIQASVTNAGCFGSATGSIAVTGTSSLVAPIKYLWSNGYNTATISNLVAGTYTVLITDANGCKVSKDYTVGQSAPITYSSVVVEPDCGQSNGSVSIANPTGGIGTSYTYSWSTGPTTPAITGIPYGIYTLTVTGNGGCTANETFNVTEVGGPIVFGFVTPAGCNNSNGGVNATAIPTLGGGNFVYDWSNTATTEDISGVPAGNYVLEVMDDNGCFGMQSFDVTVRPPAKNQICAVNVDRASSTNMVIWEKLETTGIAYYNIYRETAALNEFLLIDSVSFDQVSVFNDVVANPISTSWRYRISAVNECDIEGPLSSAHKTIHLVQEIDAGFAKLNWDFYEGASYSEVEISRYTDADGWEVIAPSVPANVTSYNDILFPIQSDSAGLDYDIGFEIIGGCTATGKAEDFNYVRSNRSRGVFNPGYGTGAHSNNSLAELSNGNISLIYYPNPTSKVLFIELEASEASNYQMMDMMGKVISNGTLNPGQSNINVSSLPKGVYFIQLTDQEGMRFKFVKN